MLRLKKVPVRREEDADFRMGSYTGVRHVLEICLISRNFIPFVSTKYPEGVFHFISLLTLDPTGPDVLDPDAYLWPDSNLPLGDATDNSPRPPLPLSQPRWDMAHKGGTIRSQNRTQINAISNSIYYL
jgi:hypothetical protein